MASPPLAVSYGSNARVVEQGQAVGQPPGARLQPGSCAGGPVAAAKCAGITKHGTPCGAPPAKGTELCVGHLRSEGRL